MSERRCPKCGSVYTDTGARFCPKDGSMLVEIQARKPAAPPAAGAPSSGSGTGVRTPLPPGKAGLDRASSLSNQILDARYQVLKKLGEGGMSYVYLAKEISSDAIVAIKVLSPRLASDKSSVERLRREAGLAMRLDHPNVCRILRLGESDDGLIYLVMPFLKGELLSDREVRGGPMEMTLGVTLLKQMCAGLHHAHELNPQDSESSDLLFLSILKLGYKSGESGQYTQSLRYFEEAAKLRPNEPEPHVGMASVYTQTGHQAQALAEQREVERLSKKAEPNR